MSAPRHYSAADIKKLESNVVTEESVAVFHILQLSEQGRFVEVLAQMIASYFHSGDVDGGEVMSTLNDLTTRMFDLILGPHQIWRGLLPGAPFPNARLLVISEDEYNHLTEIKARAREMSLLLDEARG